jgi:hypothetical protein
MEKEKDRAWKAFELTGDEPKFNKEIKDVMAKIEALEKQNLELERRIEASKQAEVDMDSIKRFCELARSNLADLTFENKRLALQALNIKVWVNGGNVTIEGTIPVGEDNIASTLLANISLMVNKSRKTDSDKIAEYNISIRRARLPYH